jgi:glycosyltransferase involved in cell wall biosynthesis
VRTISVIIPVWNRASEVCHAIDSALAQTLPPFEVIVVDDGSTDETLEVLARYRDRIRALRQDNQGVAAARNAGIAVARGDLLAFLDSDDVWLPRKLELQAARIEADPGLGLVHCGGDFEGTGVNLNGMEGSVASEILRLDRSVILAHGSGVMVPRRVAEEVGGFDARMRVSEDWDFCYRVASRYRIGFVAEALVLHARHPTGLQNDIVRMEHGMLLALEKAFANPTVRPLRRHTYGRLHRILSGCYFQQRQWRAFLRHFVKSVRWDWRNLAYFAAYPLRAVRRRIKTLGPSTTPAA